MMPRRKHDSGTDISFAERRLRGGSHPGAAFDAPFAPANDGEFAVRRHPPSKMRTDSGDEDGGNDALQFAVNIAWLPELAGKADRDLPALTRDHPAFCRNLGTEVRAFPAGIGQDRCDFKKEWALP